MSSFQVYPENVYCSYCNKAFSTRQGLKVHERLHKGEYRHYCGVCGKGFMGKTHLNGHMVFHTGVRGFECPFCGKKYAYKFHLKEHIEHKHNKEYVNQGLSQSRVFSRFIKDLSCQKT